MPRVVHFEAYVDDVDRASKFYSNVFGVGVIEADASAE
jgi:predicted enzyme related to lactoylglutathione lyase